MALACGNFIQYAASCGIVRYVSNLVTLFSFERKNNAAHPQPPYAAATICHICSLHPFVCRSLSCFTMEEGQTLSLESTGLVNPQLSKKVRQLSIHERFTKTFSASTIAFSGKSVLFRIILAFAILSFGYDKSFFVLPFLPFPAPFFRMGQKSVPCFLFTFSIFALSFLTTFFRDSMHLHRS